MEVKKSNLRNTERYDLSILVTDEGNLNKILDESCRANNAWPFRISRGKKGFVVSFLKHPDEPTWRYSNVIMEIVNDIKMRFALFTVMMVKNKVTIDINKLPKEIRDFKSVDAEKTDENECSLLKRLAEDDDFFKSHTKKQLEESDYDTARGKEVARHAIAIDRYNNRLSVIEEEEPTFYKNGKQKSCEGQLTLNF